MTVLFLPSLACNYTVQPGLAAYTSWYSTSIEPEISVIKISKSQSSAAIFEDVIDGSQKIK